MMNLKYRLVIGLAALAVAFCVQVAMAQVVLFSDSFNRVSGTPNENGMIDDGNGGMITNPLASTSWGDNDNSLGGDVIQTYEIGPDLRGGNRHQYVDGDVARFRAGWSEIQYDFASDPRVSAGGGISIEFDATVADLTAGWLALSIGQSEAETTDGGDNNSIFLMVEDTVDLGLLFGGISGSGVPTILEVFEGDDSPDAFDVALTGDWGFGTDPNDEQNFRIEIATDNFAVDQATATANVFVTDTFGTRQVLTDYVFDWDADGEAYIAFSSNKDQGCGPECEDPSQEVQIDNLVISTLSTPVLGDGDYNGNGVVDAADYTLWRDTEGDSVASLSGADGDGDGVIGPGDYNLWVNNFGNVVSTSTSIPEPSSLVLLTAMVVGGVCRARRS